MNLVNQLVQFFLATVSVEETYQVVHELIASTIEKSDIYQSLLSVLVRNEVLLLQNAATYHELRVLIRQEAFSIVLLYAQSSILDIGVFFFNHISSFIPFNDYCRHFYEYLSVIPISCYSSKMYSDLWKNFVNYLLSLFNQWKDIPQTDSFFGVFLLNYAHCPSRDSSLFIYLGMILKVAIVSASYVLIDKRRITSYIYSLCYIIILLSFLLIDAVHNTIWIVEIPSEHTAAYASLVQLANEYHTFSVLQSPICGDNNGAYLLLQLYLISNSPFAIEGENLMWVYQCLRCLFNLNVVITSSF